MWFVGAGVEAGVLGLVLRWGSGLELGLELGARTWAERCPDVVGLRGPAASQDSSKAREYTFSGSKAQVRIRAWLGSGLELRLGLGLGWRLTLALGFELGSRCGWGRG